MEWKKLPVFNVKNSPTPMINEEIDLTPEEIEFELEDETKQRLIEKLMKRNIQGENGFFYVG